MNSKLSQLYQQVILKHNNEPFHFEKRLSAPYIVEAYNPLCGDKFKLFLDIEAGFIKKATFHGYGCAISKASTSVLMQKMQGQTLENVSLVIENYFKMLEDTEGVNADEELTAFVAAKDFPARLKCATLAWDALDDFLKKL